MAYRVSAAMEVCNLNREKATKYIKEADEARNRWIQWVHGVDADDIRTYDLVINLERVPVESAAAIIQTPRDRDGESRASE